MHVHPSRRRKKFGAKFTWESCKCTPRQRVHPFPEAEQESNFYRKLGDLDGGRDYLGSFSVCFEGDD